MSEPDAHLRHRYQPWIGRSIQKYRIEALLGVGGMAAVFRARHRNGHRVALKVLHAEQSLDARIRKRFLREGYVANKVGHPGVVRVLDDDVSEDGTAFLVMELLEGQTLESRWDRCSQRLPVREVMCVGHQVLDVLSAAHAGAIVHRDIKPENLFVTNEGLIRVLDFGIARLEEGGSRSQTRTGATFGTPSFMPPEQALGKRQHIDGRTDLWATGATMFTLLSGRYVHEAESLEELVVFAATRPARPLASVAEQAPAPVARVVDRALAFDRADRWPDARSMQEALERAYCDVFGESLTAAEAVRGVAEARAADVGDTGPQRAFAMERPRAMAYEALSAPSGTPRRRTSRRERWLSFGAGLALAGAGLAYFLARNKPTAGDGPARTAAIQSGAEAFPLAATTPTTDGSSPSLPIPVVAPKVAGDSVVPSATPQPSTPNAHSSPTRRPALASGRAPGPATAASARPPAPELPQRDIFKP